MYIEQFIEKLDKEIDSILKRYNCYKWIVLFMCIVFFVLLQLKDNFICNILGSLLLVIPLLTFKKLMRISEKINGSSDTISKLIDNYIKDYSNKSEKCREIERAILVEKKGQYFDKNTSIIDVIYFLLFSLLPSILKKLIINSNDIEHSINLIYALSFTFIFLIIYKYAIFSSIPSVEKIHKEYYQKVIYRMDIESIKEMRKNEKQ